MIEIFILDRTYPTYKPGKRHRHLLVRRVGKFHEVVVGGERVRVEMFPFPVMAEAIGRSVLTLKQWVKVGFFPQPIFTMARGRKRRLYSAGQVVNLNNLFWVKYRGVTRLQMFGTGIVRRDRWDEFLHDVKVIFPVLNVLSEEEFSKLIVWKIK